MEQDKKNESFRMRNAPENYPEYVRRMMEEADEISTRLSRLVYSMNSSTFLNDDAASDVFAQAASMLEYQRILYLRLRKEKTKHYKKAHARDASRSYDVADDEES